MDKIPQIKPIRANDDEIVLSRSQLTKIKDALYEHIFHKDKTGDNVRNQWRGQHALISNILFWTESPTIK